MHKKIMQAVAALAVFAAFVGASSASAATLYKTSAHTTPVAVGTTFTVRQPTYNQEKFEPKMGWTQQANESSEGFRFCAEAFMEYKVTQNSGGVFKAEGTKLYFPESWCSPLQQTGFNPGLLQVSGSAVAVSGNSVWTGTTLSNMRWYIGPEFPVGSHYSGEQIGNFTGATGSPPAKGIMTRQPSVAKAPISIVFDRAGVIKQFSGGLSTSILTAQFDFSGTAASWSFG
jgi:hypothetical protein